jgi:transcriptional regulator with XRE-family HTH domain
MESWPAITAALAEVGPRLKRARAQRDVTLTELAAATGISKSTLSRLEAGKRRPSLELLLPIAQAHQIPLDELVGAPEVGDPRVRFTQAKPLADHDITMGPGEVAEFDTRLPHWFGAAAHQPVEVLSLLGRQGERIHVRAAPRRTAGNA